MTTPILRALADLYAFRILTLNCLNGQCVKARLTNSLSFTQSVDDGQAMFTINQSW